MTTAPQTLVTEPLLPVLQGICHLSVRRRRGLVTRTENNSTGAVIDGRFVLTAAHNVFSTAMSKVLSIDVRVGRSQIDDGQEAVRVTGVRTARNYDWREFGRDFAVLRLADAVALPRPFELGTVAAETPLEIVNIAGYPGAGGGLRDGRHLFAGSGRGRISGEGPFIDYDIDTETGNSGGPVWVESASGAPLIVGVHVMGLEQVGRARACDELMATEVREMIAQLSAS